MIATELIEERALRLVPFSTILVFQNPKPGDSPINLLVESPENPAETLHARSFFTLPTPGKPNTGAVVPFWGAERFDSAKAMTNA